MSIENIQLEINGYKMDASIEFDFFPGKPEQAYGPPEDCYPREHDEYELHKMVVMICGSTLDLSEILYIAEVVEDIEAQLNDIICQ